MFTSWILCSGYAVKKGGSSTLAGHASAEESISNREALKPGGESIADAGLS